MKLGTLLLRDAIISLNQLEASLRTQVLYGGRLGTNLVELDFIDLDTLGKYLATVLDVPLATHDDLDSVDGDILEQFGASLADLYTAIPLGMSAANPDALRVAFADPRDDNAIRQLAQQCGCPIEPHIAPELRIFYFLEKHYHVSRKARFVRTGTRRRLPSEISDRRRTQAPGGIEIPPTVRFDPKPKDGEVDDARSNKTNALRVTYQETCSAIDSAEHRDEIGDALIEYAAGRFEVAVVFLLRDSNALGWRFYSTGTGSTADVESLGLPLGGASVLQAAHDAGAAFRGGPPSAGRPIETRLWEATGTTSPPDEVVVVPVLVRRRIVNLFYAHSHAGAPISSEHFDELQALASRCSDAYMRLIQTAKTAARAETAE